MKRRYISALLACILLALLCSCAGKSADMIATEEIAYDAAAPAGGAFEPQEAGMSSPVQSVKEQNAEAKLIYTAQIDMETTAFEEAVSALAALTEQCGGYYEQSSANTWSGYRHGEYIIRVPATQYRTFLDGAGKLCHVTYQREQAEDVSEAYYDADGRLKTQRTKLARLQELLTQADNMEDIIAIESAISETEEMIDILSGELRRYDSLVDYSTVTVSLSEVYKLSNVEEAPIGFGSRMGAALSGGWRSFVNGVETIVIAIAGAWAWLILIAAVAVAVIALVRRGDKRRTEKPRPAPPVYSKPEQKKKDE